MKNLEIQSKLEQYLVHEKNPFFREEALKISQDEQELIMRFSEDLEFGTAGLRGIIGAGSAYINPYNVKKATQSLCDYITFTKTNSSKNSSLSAVVSYDSRLFSSDFALETALVFCANKFKTYLFTNPRPTPMLSFTIRHLKADTGVMITASHNPPQYNGYKAYWSNGCQIIPPHDNNIIEIYKKNSVIKSLSTGSVEEKRKQAIEQGLLIEVDEEFDEIYLKHLNQCLPNFQNLSSKDTLKVIYTPLHGVGGLLVHKLIKEKNITLIPVEKQMKPDGNFPSLKSPNPEDLSAYNLSIELANSQKADIIIANDPDADRMGCMVKDQTNQWTFINGNQIGCLFLEYLLSQDPNPQQAFTIKSIVTTNLQKTIAAFYETEIYETLTGFKWIGTKMDEIFEKYPHKHIALANEESYGYLIGDSIRDKDALVASKLILEVTLYAKSLGLSLWEYLEKFVYKKHKFYEDQVISKEFQGMEGNRKREQIMKNFREKNLTTIGSFNVLYKKDYLLLEEKKLDGSLYPINPQLKTNAIEVALKENLNFFLRPSGTEPKMKVYLSGWGKYEQKEEVIRKIRSLEKELQSYLD